MPIAWNEALSSGVKEVDDAHKTLITWINKLGDAMKQANGKAEVMRILDFLGSYAKQHFASEEQCMHRLQCPAAQANKKAHAEFLAYFTKMRSDCDRNGITSATVLDLDKALSDWLRSHIMKVDSSLKTCVKQQPAPDTAARGRQAAVRAS